MRFIYIILFFLNASYLSQKKLQKLSGVQKLWLLFIFTKNLLPDLNNLLLIYNMNNLIKKF